MDEDQQRWTLGNAIAYSTALAISLAASGAGNYSPGAGCSIRGSVVKICSEPSHNLLGHIHLDPPVNHASSTGSGFGLIDMSKVACATAT